MRKLILLATFASIMVLPAAGQTFVVNGGSVFNERDEPGLIRGNYSSLQVGIRAWVVRNFEVQGSVTVLSEPSVDAALRFRPFRSLQLEPYLYTGFGYLFASDDFRSVVPAGLGVEYAIDDQWGVHLETAAV